MKETIDDILAKMREEKRPYGVSIERLRDYADRIEAAVQRERGALVAEAEAAKDARNRVAVSLGVQYAERCRECKSKSGNAAAMREALELCVREMCRYCRAEAAHTMPGLECLEGCEALRIAKAALSAPARNCDRFATAAEAHIAFQRFCRGNYRQGLAASGLDGCDDCELCETKNMSGEDSCPFFWLLGTEGGAE